MRQRGVPIIVIGEKRYGRSKPSKVEFLSSELEDNLVEFVVA